MFYFHSRDKARAFATKTGYRLIDLGNAGKFRWAVQVLVAGSELEDVA